MASLRERLAQRARELKHDLQALALAWKHPEVPLRAKLLIALAVAYALSPIDLIPDFIPVLGYIDDLILLPGLLWLAIRLIPPSVMQDCRLQAQQDPPSLKANWIVAGLILLIWIGLLLGAIHWIWGWF